MTAVADQNNNAVTAVDMPLKIVTQDTRTSEENILLYAASSNGNKDESQMGGMTKENERKEMGGPGENSVVASVEAPAVLRSRLHRKLTPLKFLLELWLPRRCSRSRQSSV
jgi:hypothetical protein